MQSSYHLVNRLVDFVNSVVDDNLSHFSADRHRISERFQYRPATIDSSDVFLGELRRAKRRLADKPLDKRGEKR